MKASDGGSDKIAPRMGDVAGDGNGASSSAWGAAGPDGGPQPMIMPEPEPALAFEVANVPCLRGPCRYYFAAESHFDHGNPQGTFALGHEPRARHHACSAIPGVWLELSGDSPVYDCNHWDPVDEALVLARNLRRQRYFDKHPGEAMQQKRIGDDLDELDDLDDDPEVEDEGDDEGEAPVEGFAEAPRPHAHRPPTLSKVQILLLSAAEGSRLSLPCEECGQYVDVDVSQEQP